MSAERSSTRQVSSSANGIDTKPKSGLVLNLQSLGPLFAQFPADAEDQRVRLNLDSQGGWLVRPAELARRLKIEEAALRKQGALGLIDSRLDRGYGRDEGRSRVTITVGKFSWQGIFGADGFLISEFQWQRPSHVLASNRRTAL
jgi:hypothetical protein